MNESTAKSQAPEDAKAAQSSTDAAFALVDADVIDRVRQLELFSRFRVEGFMQGQNLSPFKGTSADFLQHRQYFAGDNLKYLDWRVYGKSEKLYVREYEETTNTRVSLILDTSNSMAFQAPDALYSKHEFALRCVAIMSYLAFLRKDSFSLTLFDTDARVVVPFGSGRKHLQRVLLALVSAAAGGATDFPSALETATAPIRRKGLSVVISDFMDDASRIVPRISRLRFAGSDVIAMQVFDPAERQLDFQTITRFHDLEGGDVLTIDPQIIARQYQQAFDEHQNEMRNTCQQHGFDHIALPVCDNYEVPILEYVRRRMELGL